MAQATFWGDLIKGLRVENKMSRRTLASIAGVNRQTLQRLENGETFGEIDMIERCLSVFGYELEAILCESKEQLKKREEAAHSTPKGKAILARERLLRL